MSSPSRLAEIDALRGVAALAVVLFHLSTRFAELYGDTGRTTVSLPVGHYGVNLFFIISGFVIFMTLDKTKRPMDFVVSRFSRLYPVYWVSVVLTFLVTAWLGLPGKEVDVQTMFANLLMFHGLFGVPHVDGVYWTLEVELLFYAGMLALFWIGWMRHVLWVLAGLIALRLVYQIIAWVFGIDLPWTIFRLLILKYIPWFALGVCAFLLTHRDARHPVAAVVALAVAAIVVLAIAETPQLAALAAVLFGLVLAAASGRLRWLRAGWLLWLGAISYPLYLIHENISWSIQLRLHALRVPPDLAALIALAIALALATVLTRAVEQPAMRVIRDRYRRRSELKR